MRMLMFPDEILAATAPSKLSEVATGPAFPMIGAKPGRQQQTNLFFL
jgi:hypothetical protein